MLGWIPILTLLLGTITLIHNISKNCWIIQNKKDTKLYQRAITEIKYSGYIKKQIREINKTKKQNNKQIPSNIKYGEIHGLSNEVKEKLTKTQPQTIGAASQIEGVTPAAINLILIHLKKKELVSQNA